MVKICSTDYPVENEATYKEHFDVFPYELSPFQKHAIEAIVEGNNALITAHTGSGKTLPAEFAIQYFVNKGKKLFYCSPIKALSNQKYYEFTNKYPHIKFGLRTGDIACNSDADVVICTTEILMNFLFSYDKNDSLKNQANLDFNINIDNELACVIIDEIHYINDLERGKNYEKTLMMLPPNIQLVMLSATIDNPEGFAKWIESGRFGKETSVSDCKETSECKDSSENKIVYLASSTHRVVPLTHYAYLTTTEASFKGLKDKELEKFIRDNTNTFIEVNSANNKFNENNVQTVSKVNKFFEMKQSFMKRSHVLNNCLLHLRDKDMLPAIAFVFSRKNVELYAKEITTNLLEFDSKVPYTIRRECEQIIRKLPNYQEYLELPEYNSLVSLLEKGIGIHHSGMQSILREIVELMISKKYIKLLFATESFSIGLDCPIRTAIFTSLTKFDGNHSRYLYAHEYTQMAGRAGRRSIDTIGNVIHLNNLFQLPTMSEYKQILSGKPQQLVSKFHISYPVILNLIKNGQTTDFHHFSEKSMVQDELIKSLNQKRIDIDTISEKLHHKRTSIQTIKTPYDTCIQYKNLEDSIKMLQNKKRKEAEREMKSIQDQYRSINDDMKKVRELLALEDDYLKQCDNLKYLESYIETKTRYITDILVDEGFISRIDDTRHYSFTDLGTIASGIAEVHPLIISKLMVQNNYFIDFSIKQLVGLFSCYTDIKIPDDEKFTVPHSEDAFLQNKVKELQHMYLYYQNKEYEVGINTGIRYEDSLIFDMIDFAMKWCDCSNEYECKYFIQNDIAEKSISVGDFNKGMLKIVTISRELANVCEQIGQIELLHKLSQIEGLVLKYITTSQSLYV
jgi:superfamily II RNA helicase